MPWLTLTFRSDPASAPGLAEALAEAGALAVTMEDGADSPIIEPAVGESPLWPTTCVEALFDDADQAALLRAVRGHRALASAPEPTVARVEDRDWARVGLAGLGAMAFGGRLWVIPSWLEPPEPAAVVLRLDPGLAFGTGRHPTTALCLDWLAGADLAGARLVDYGCGSGILAVAGLLLGASRAWAVDHDPQALVATRDNGGRNGVAGRLEVTAPEALDSPPADVVVANILARPLVELAPRLAGLLAPGGWLVLSGLLADQAPDVAEAYRPWLALAVDGEREGWCRLSGQRAV
jgi:ribosomal protein L11 methyltransferase